MEGTAKGAISLCSQEAIKRVCAQYQVPSAEGEDGVADFNRRGLSGVVGERLSQGGSEKEMEGGRELSVVWRLA